jgi:hypothetical protein
MPQPKCHASAAARQAAYRKRCDSARRVELASKGLPSLPAISTMPGWSRWNASLNAARELVERAVEEMQEYFDERSEEWQESERAEEHQEKIDSIQTLLDAFGELTF